MLKCEPKQCNLSYTYANKNTALILACQNNMFNIVSEMLECGPKQCNLNFIDNNKHTALMYACKNNMQ